MKTTIDIKSSISEMNKAIKSYVDSELKKLKVKESAKQGTIRGSRLIYKNKSYDYIPVVDEYFGNGDTVWFLLDESESIAIVVGV
jgi:predicted glycosyltransferase involved in capsule biosynthesis